MCDAASGNTEHWEPPNNQHQFRNMASAGGGTAAGSANLVSFVAYRVQLPCGKSTQFSFFTRAATLANSHCAGADIARTKMS